MLNKMNPRTNAINWFDIPVNDLDRAKRFYETIFNIDMETQTTNTGEEMAFFPRLPDTIMGLSGILSGALVKGNELKPGKDGPLIYLNASPKLQRVLDKVTAAGGKVEMPATKIPAGCVAVVIDTEGNKVGLHAEE